MRVVRPVMLVALLDESLPPEAASSLTEKRDHVARLRWLGGLDVVSVGGEDHGGGTPSLGD